MADADADADAAAAAAPAAPTAPPSPRRTSSPVPIPVLVRARSSSSPDAPSAPSAESAPASLTSSSSSASPPDQERRASAHAGAARLRRDTNLKIFLPADDMALKAILSPPLGRSDQSAIHCALPSCSSSSLSESDGPRLLKSRSATAVGAATANLFDKLLFRTPAPSDSATANSSSSNNNNAAAATTTSATTATNSSSSSSVSSDNSSNALDASLSPGARAKTSTGSLVEEDLELADAGVAVLNTSLPPPPFANMFACDACREDIGSLLTKGRHHCRNCGGSFCADCSSRAAVVPFQAYLSRGELRVCDACFHRIRNFQAQVRSQQVTWGGLPPPPAEDFRRAFKLPEDEDPVSVFHCSLFLDITPYYGHLFLTRRHMCFQPYVARNGATPPAAADSLPTSMDNVDVSSSYAVPGTPRAPPRALKVPYARIVSLVKPQFYYINGLQVKTDAKHKFFLAEFNGLRDMCFLRLDQLIRARQQQPGATSKLSPPHHHHHPHSHTINSSSSRSGALGQGSPGERLSTQDLLQQAMVRRKSYRKLVAELPGATATATAACASPASSAPSAMLTPPVDASDMLNFASQQSSVGFFDMDDGDGMRGSGEFATDTGEILATDDVGLLPTSTSILEEEEDEEEEEEDEDGDDKGARASAIGSNCSSSSDDESFEPLPPDEPLGRTTILLDCDLRADVKQAFDLLWNDDAGREFTVANLKLARDVDISVGTWRAIGEDEREEVHRGAVVSTERDYAMWRRVASKHPPKISFPGLPPYASCVRTQRFRLDASSQGGDKWDRFVVSDVMRMRQIPFCDYFEIETRWVFSRDGRNYCHVQAGLVVNFLKATWFKSQITSSTKSESKEAFEQWAKQAIEHLAVHQQRVASASSSAPSAPRLAAACPPTKARTRVSISSRELQQSSDERAGDAPTAEESAISSAWTKAPPPLASDADDDGVVADVRGLLTLLASSSYTQWVVLALLLYCLLVIRSQQFQIQQLATTTALLLERLQQSGGVLAPPATAATATTATTTTPALQDACQQQVLDGARRALEQFFDGASA